MAAFTELIKKFDKVRDYARDFYIYGFKTRKDFDAKSPRTYDNEKRRIEGYLNGYIKWSYSGGKCTMISLDSSKISENPLYAAWKSKSFTSNDIHLHFYLLDFLRSGEALSVEELTDLVCMRSGRVFDSQTVRNKCAEYAREGIFVSEKRGRKILYGLSNFYFKDAAEKFPLLTDAVKFFTETAPLGVIGSFITDNEDEENRIFSFKHHYIVHTLEDGVLFDLLNAIRKNAAVRLVSLNEKRKEVVVTDAVPLKIFVSSLTGRRYGCFYTVKRKRFSCYRLDYIKSVSVIHPENADAAVLRGKLENHLPMLWGVNFGGRARLEVLSIKLHIDEVNERYVLDRIIREGRSGRLSKIEPDTFLFTVESYDVSEMTPWIKTITGRIISLESTNASVVRRFNNDMAEMIKMYGEEI